MPDAKAFITALMTKAQTVLPASYYEEGPADGAMPYAVVSVRFTDTDESTVTAAIEVDHWHNDEAGNAVALEDQCNTLRSGMDKQILHSVGKFRAILYFEAQAAVPVEPEIELIHRQQVFQARIYNET